MKNNQTMLRILKGSNPYSYEVQGKANEPICVLNLLLSADKEFGLSTAATQEQIVERLDENAPRVAIITGSADHPAHVTDRGTMLKAAVSIWNHGGVPFAFGIPVMCDGTAQSNLGMCYSLESRNLVTRMIINQMESHSYHGAFVLQGCDKTPFAAVCALAMLDRCRQARREAPVFASFAPSHVLRGGAIPDDLRQELFCLAEKCEESGFAMLAGDLRLTLNHILQCTSNQAFQGIFHRMVQAGLLDATEQKNYEKRLAANTCHIDGGICAFNGTGNSCRHAVSALGLVHPALEFLTGPPAFEQIDKAVKAMLSVCNNPEFSASNIVIKNKENAIRVHSASGGSTNLMMHLAAAFIHAGERFSIHNYDKIRGKIPVPDLINYSLTEGRDIFALALQCQEGTIAGITTVMHELKRNGVPVTEDAPTMAGCTWKERLKQGARLAADNVKNNPVLLAKPKRPNSGIDVLKGNFFESAVVKISGMTEEQINWFDEKMAMVLYFENEEEAIAHLLNNQMLEKIIQKKWLSRAMLLSLYRYNTKRSSGELEKIDCRRKVFHRLIEEDAFRMAVIIAGQGPEAFGMPEMFTPMQHLNHNLALKKICTIISDGRYSGVSYGAAIGHVTPEAYNRGGILYLESGDLLHLQLRKRKVNLLDPAALIQNTVQLYQGNLAEERKILGEKRLKAMKKRLEMISPVNRMTNITDAAHGAVPKEVWDWSL